MPILQTLKEIRSLARFPATGPIPCVRASFCNLSGPYLTPLENGDKGPSPQVGLREPSWVINTCLEPECWMS